MSETAYKGVGELLRRARELKKLSFDEVYSELRIHPKFLEAMEEEQFEELPGDAYIKPFLRTYSIFLGINIDEKLDSEPEREIVIPSKIAPVPQKKSNLKRWLQVSLLYLGALGVISIIGLKSGILDIYRFKPQTVSPTEKMSPAPAQQNFLLELMVFDSLTAIVISQDDTLLARKLCRGNVMRFSNRDSYDLILTPAQNCRVYANRSPLYFPGLANDTLRITLNEVNYQPYIDTLFLGEVPHETNPENQNQLHKKKI